MTFRFVTLMEGAPKVPRRNTFMEAWNDMFQYVKARLDEGNMTHQELDTAIWIDKENGPPIMFHDARDRAIDNGWVMPS